MKIKYKREKRFWGTFRIHQLISTANPALFEGPDLFVCFYLFQTQVWKVQAIRNIYKHISIYKETKYTDYFSFLKSSTVFSIPYNISQMTSSSVNFLSIIFFVNLLSSARQTWRAFFRSLEAGFLLRCLRASFFIMGYSDLTWSVFGWWLWNFGKMSAKCLQWKIKINGFLTYCLQPIWKI